MKSDKLLSSIAAVFLISSLNPAFADTATMQNVSASSGDADQKVKCRKVEVTGSLVRKGKVCRTIAEWKRLQQLGNDAARAMAGEQVCSGGLCRGFEPPPGG